MAQDSYAAEVQRGGQCDVGSKLARRGNQYLLHVKRFHRGVRPVQRNDADVVRGGVGHDGKIRSGINGHGSRARSSSGRRGSQALKLDGITEAPMSVNGLNAVNLAPNSAVLLDAVKKTDWLV